MSADIVARARIAMRQANQPPEPDSAADNRPAGEKVLWPTSSEPRPAVGDEVVPQGSPIPDDLVGASDGAPDAPQAAAVDVRSVDEQATGPDAPAALPETPSFPAPPGPAASTEAPRGAPWERQVTTPDGDRAQRDGDGGGERVWSGYNPDYVADRLVPMIHARATTGWRSRLGLQPSKAEQLHQRLQAAMCVNFAQPVKVVVANPRGYSGKTIISILLAGALGLARGGGVCAFENHELRGVMALRTVTNGTQLTTRDFINQLSEMTAEQVRHADLTRYVRHQHAGNFDAMVTSRNFGKQLNGAELRAALALLARFYQVIVIDTANNEAHEAFRAACQEATVLVVPTKWRPTHITPATQMLNDMAEESPRHRVLVQNAVVVATNGPGEVVPGAREMALPMFSALANTVIEVPPDPHIEADRPILHHQLRPATRSALDKLGAAVCGAAVNNLREMERL